jgi:hypothetical protein
MVTGRRDGDVDNNRALSAHERVLAVLWDWRDETARECDESLLYVCPNPALLRLSLASSPFALLPFCLLLPTDVEPLQCIILP